MPTPNRATEFFFELISISDSAFRIFGGYSDESLLLYADIRNKTKASSQIVSTYLFHDCLKN